MVSQPGKRYRNYQIIRPLGKGGFAIVYLGQHEYLKTYAAIKVLLVQLENEGIDAFLHEARTLANLKHPNIVQVIDFDVDEDSIPYLVMSYAPNGSLRDRHPKGIPLQPDLVLHYVRQVASALQYAHDRKLIHRDVNPRNLLLGENDQVLLSDFGLALMAHSTLSQSLQNIAGTAGYMPPEQFEGKPDLASDQYALGVVVYQWLCGQLPFSKGNREYIEYQHRNTPPPSLREKIPAISPAIEKVVLRALEKNPKDRFPRVQDFADALQQAYESEPYHLSSTISPAPLPLTLSWPTTEPEDEHDRKAFSNAFDITERSLHTPANGVKDIPSSPQTQEKGSHTLPIRDDVKKALAASQPSPTASNTDTSVPAAHPSAQKNADTLLPTLPLSPGQNANVPSPTTPFPTIPDTPVPHTALPGAPLPTPSPPPSAQAQPLLKSKVSRRWAIRWIISFIILVVSAGIAWLLERTLLARPAVHNPTPTPTPGTTFNPPKQPPPTATPAPVGELIRTYNARKGDMKGVAWSPDGSLIASVDGQTVEVWNAFTGMDTLSPPYNRDSKQLKSLSWSPDGEYIVSGGDDKTVHVWEATTGNDLPFSPYKKHSDYVRGVAWSPNGRYIASGSQDKTVHVWEATTGNDLPFSPYRGHSGYVITVAWSPDSQKIASASWDRSVQVWDASSGQRIFRLPHNNGVRGVAWSPDGSYIASGCDDKNVYLWNAVTGTRVIPPFPGHKDSVQAVTWSPNGRYIASASFDATVKIWDIKTGVCVYTYGGHQTAVWAVSWSPDGKYIASGSMAPNASVQVWKAV